MLTTAKNLVQKAHSRVLALVAFVTTLVMTSSVFATSGGSVTQPNFGNNTAHQQYAAGSNATKVSKNIVDTSAMFWIVVCSIATFIGLVFGLLGFLKVRKAANDQSVDPMTGWIFIGVGACLVVLPWFIYTFANTITT